MTDRIEPALTPEQWAVALHQLRRTPHPEEFDADLAPTARALKYVPWTRQQQGKWPSIEMLPQRIALANAALPDGHPQKITRETVRAILSARVAYPLGSASHRELIQIAAALGSYLPSDQQPPELDAAYAAYLPPE